MSDIVQKNIEQSLADVEDFENAGIFDSNETRMIIKRLRSLFCRLVKRHRNLTDYLLLINYELSLLKLIRLRKTRNVKARKRLEQKLLNRISSVFCGAAFGYFKYDLRLWISYASFCEKEMGQILTSRVWSSIVRLFPNNARVWIKAAQFEARNATGGSISRARALYQRALRFLPCDLSIFLEYFTFELEEVLKIDNESNSIDIFSVPHCVFVHAMQKLMNPESGLLFLKRARSHDVLVKMMLETLKAKFPDNPSVSSFEIEMPLFMMEKDVDIKENKSKTIKCNASFDVDMMIINAYKQNSPKLDNFYLKFCIRQASLKDETLRNKRVENLIDALNNVKSIDCDEILHFLCTVPSDDKNVIARICEIATKFHPTCSKLWAYWIQASENPQEIFDMVPAPKPWSLWEVFLSRIPDAREKLWEAIKIPKVAVNAKTCLLKLLINNNASPSEIKCTFGNLTRTPPVSYELYKIYIDNQLANKEIDYVHMTQIFEDATRRFGSTNVDLWLDYIDFVRSHYVHWNDIDLVYRNAVNSLDPQFLTLFTDRFCLNQINN